MISQNEFQKLIQKNRIELDKMNELLAADPELRSQPYPSAQDPEYTYSHHLTKLVAEKMLLRSINGQNP